MTKTFRIESKAAVDMGVYEAETAEQAVAALNADVGSESTLEDWTVYEVMTASQIMGCAMNADDAMRRAESSR